MQCSGGRTLKKQILVLSVFCLLFLSFVTPAHAIKPPKELCLQFNSFSDFQMLAIKKVGKVHGATANTTMFNIAGSWDAGPFIPVSGTGYVVPGTTTFHASLNGAANTSSYMLAAGELVYDLSTDTGTIYYHYQFAGGTIISGSDSLAAVDCSGYDPGITSGTKKSTASKE
jgi:hypothetical protein